MSFIKFNVGNTDCYVKIDGANFSALDPRETDYTKSLAMGYYSTLNGAVMKHVKNLAIDTSSEEVVELKDYMSKLKLLCEEVMSAEFTYIEVNNKSGDNIKKKKEEPTPQVDPADEF